jgi:adenine phosphoribosyltransferase
MSADELLRDRLRASFVWRSAEGFADVSHWWTDPTILREIGPALAHLHAEERPTLVAGIEALGFLLGPLVATTLGIGFVEVRKGLIEADLGDQVAVRATPPDYNQRNLTLGIRRRLLRPRERVLLVDEWIKTGAQATAAKRIVEDLACEFLGIAVIVDATENPVRRELNVRSLLSIHELG